MSHYPAADMQESPSNRLDYAPSTKPARWRRLKGALLLLMLMGVVLGVYRHGLDVLRKVEYLYHQRGCLRYTAAPDQVVFDSNPARVATLANDPNFVIVGGCAFRKPPSDWAAYPSSLAVGNYVSFAPPNGLSVLFLHERLVNNVRYLIMVERTSDAGLSPYFIPGYDIELRVIAPATLRTAAQEHSFAYAIDVLDSMGPHTDIRIYAGQSDPTDESRFTIRYEFQGKSRVVEGRVAADGSVDFHRLGE
jgi:hypothetical protein